MKNHDMKHALNSLDTAPVEKQEKLEQELRQKLSQWTKYARFFPIRQPAC